MKTSQLRRRSRASLLDGRGTATVQGTNPGVNVISIRGREITVKGFTITGGNIGIAFHRASHADINDNTISGNAGNGIAINENSGINLDLGRIQAVAQPNRTDAATTNGGFGIDCSSGSYVSGNLGTLTGAKGAMTV